MRECVHCHGLMTGYQENQVACSVCCYKGRISFNVDRRQFENWMMASMVSMIKFIDYKGW